MNEKNNEDIDVSMIPPAMLLAKLFNGSRAQGFGALHNSAGLMTEETANEILADHSNRLIDGDRPPYFDYLNGRVMKVEINEKTLEPRLYDRDLGHGAAQRCVDECLQELANEHGK